MNSPSQHSIMLQKDSIQLFIDQSYQSINKSLYKSPWKEQVLELILAFQATVDAYYETGELLVQNENDATAEQHLRKLTNRIGEEWNKLMPFLTTSFLMPPTYKAVELTIKTLDAAWENLNQEAMKEKGKPSLLPHYGRHFELVTFEYMPKIAVIGIPFNNLYSPWDWSMIWHEIAGLFVQTESAKNIIQDLLHPEILPYDSWKNWLTTYDKETSKLPRDNQHETIPAPEIRQAWLEEFLEDSIGVLCLGSTMADALERILDRHYSTQTPNLQEATDNKITSEKQSNILGEQPLDPSIGTVDIAPSIDLRHPPSALRVQLAHALSAKMGLREADENSDRGIDTLATYLYENHNAIVNRPFQEADKNQVEIIANTILETKTLPENEAPHLLVAALVKLVPTIEDDYQLGQHIQNSLANPQEKAMAKQENALIRKFNALVGKPERDTDKNID
ncbi:MAG: hypothetical protein IAF02_23890, partial [Anaerolineae bacterium]|nr:hypothetical protein [Anaerolineae bacterium]